MPIIADVKRALTRLNELLATAGWERTPTGAHGRFPEWYQTIQEWKAKFPLKFTNTEEKIQPQYASSCSTS